MLSVLSALGWLVIALVAVGVLADGEWGPLDWALVVLIPVAVLWLVIHTAVRSAIRR